MENPKNVDGDIREEDCTEDKSIPIVSPQVRAAFVSPIQVMKRHAIKANYRFGQNFLTDPNLVCKILAEAAPDHHDTVLEIGPGPATLTRMLGLMAGRVVAVELDEWMAGVARAETASLPNVEVLQMDALKLDVGEVAAQAQRPMVVVGNLPYNVSGAILMMLIRARAHINRMVLTFQKEVADRLVAPPGSRTYGALSVICRQYTDATMVMKLRPEAFVPAPKVMSGVVRFQVRHQALHPVCDDALFINLVRSIFQYRRKSLKNCLEFAGVVQPLVVLTDLGINPSVRPEMLDVLEFARMADYLSAKGSPGLAS